MQFFVVQRILGLLLMLFSLTMLPSVAVSYWYADGHAAPFLSSCALILVVGLALYLPVHNKKRDLRLRDGFMVVVLFWTALGLTGALPFMLSERPHMSLTDSVFESISGLTTTGATVLAGLDALPPSILYHRQQLQWLGGIGFVVLAVAVLPMLGVGGMQLYRAETPGPMKDEKIAPRIAQTARALWWVYVGLTAACALAYWAAGMSLFDAIGHSFSTLSTGGYSTHDASIAHFESPLIETITIVFMLLGAISFTTHFLALRGHNPMLYWRDPQVPVFLGICALLTLVITLTLTATNTATDPLTALRLAVFEVVSVITSTGYAVADFSVWPLFLPVLLIFSSFIGGCAGSTAGGLKVIRCIILAKEGHREMLRLVHPGLVQPIKLGGVPLPERVIDAVWGFFALYVVVFAVLMLAMMATGVDQVTAFGAIATTLNNCGPGLGEVSVTFATVSPTAKWISILAMLLGRLEIFTLLVLLSPAYWRK